KAFLTQQLIFHQVSKTLSRNDFKVQLFSDVRFNGQVHLVYPVDQQAVFKGNSPPNRGLEHGF
ncbi:MAG: hypothetical protein J6U54_16305, partial [Clostridiales bacterium]|nr:hypothetical protein [Clostridiales bacterium]